MARRRQGRRRGCRGLPRHRLQRAQPPRPGQRRAPGPGSSRRWPTSASSATSPPASCGPGTSRTLAYVVLDAPTRSSPTSPRASRRRPRRRDLSLFMCNSDNRADREETLPRPSRAAARRRASCSPRSTPSPPSSTQISAPGHADRDRRPDPRRRRPTARWPSTTSSAAGSPSSTSSTAATTRIAFVGGPATHRPGARPSRRSAGGARPTPASPRATCSRIDDLDAHASPRAAQAGERLAGIPGARRPTAAFCANDLLALGLLQQCVGTGLSVPGDLAIVGYDDIEFAARRSGAADLRAPAPPASSAAPRPSCCWTRPRTPTTPTSRSSSPPGWSPGSRPAETAAWGARAARPREGPTARGWVSLCGEGSGLDVDLQGPCSSPLAV